ncbi:inorganic diphosphatase [bacterium]|nr:inorganic diphosphatase [bacterium]MCI0565594.1 inorganic diphosphatase [bacterium]
MNLWHDIPYGSLEKLNVIVEIPKFSRVKYELDKETGLIKMDRVLYSPMYYPANYGFVPQTLWEDGDPLDVFVLAHEPLIPGCLVEASPIAMLPMTDGGEDDVKILSIPAEDPRLNKISDITAVEPHLLEEIRHFLKVYKDLQKKEVAVGDWHGKKDAFAAIEKSLKLYNEKFKK